MNATKQKLPLKPQRDVTVKIIVYIYIYVHFLP